MYKGKKKKYPLKPYHPEILTVGILVSLLTDLCVKCVCNIYIWLYREIGFHK